jgi:hypothetical protein
VLWIIICGVGFVTVLAILGWLSRDSRSHPWSPPALGSWTSVAAVAAAFCLGVLVTLLLRVGDGDQASSSRGTVDRPTSSARAVAPSTATSTRSTEPRQAPEGSKSPSASRSRTTSTATTERPARSTGPTDSTPRIETSTSVYFGRPSETVQIPGRYRGVQGKRELRVQLQRGSEWTQFPLPVSTRKSGEFRAYVYVGKIGTYRLRIVDPAEHRSSKPVTLELF